MDSPLIQFAPNGFVLHSGIRSKIKIECAALSDSSVASLAWLIARYVGPFSEVEGVPRGGLRLAEELDDNHKGDEGGLLIVDDVLTTGGSMEKYRAGRPARGAVLFARGACPSWITPVFSMEINAG